MDETIVELYKTNAYEELSDKLKDISIDSLRCLIDDRIVRGGDQVDDPTAILLAIFKGCSANPNHLSSHALVVFLHCFKLLASPDVSQKIATDITGILLLETDKLSTGGLVDVSKTMIDIIRIGNTGHGRVLQILPKVLMCLEQKHEIYLGSGQGSMPGYEYKKHIINTLCSGKWSSKSMIHLAEVFKDVPMSSDEMAFFLRKLLRQLERLGLQEIPPLVHQILPLGGREHHETTLRGIFAVFNKLDSKAVEVKTKPTADVSYWNEMFEIDENGDADDRTGSARALLAVEGTVLLHLTNMARWDQSLGKAFIKMLKLAKDALSEESLSRFFLAFALSLVQIKGFQEAVLNQLKAVVFRCFLHNHRQVRSNWLKRRDISVPNIQKVLLAVIDACKHGWDQVVTGIVYLGFSLMDTYGPKPGAFGRQSEKDTVKADTPQQKSCDIGSGALAVVFKSHPAVRTEIIEQILNRVLTRTSAPINHYIDILKGIAKRYPTTLLESKHKLREFFDCLSLLSPQNADCVLRAILPLLRINSHLKDSLILVLRKALFSRHANGRTIACNGFLLLLQNFKVAGYVSLSQASSQCSQSIFSISSQIHVDVHSSGSVASSSQGTNHEPLCLEVLSTLRRCLTQQAPVRATLYKGLWNVVTHNPHLATPSLEKLLEHFGRYYEDNEGVLPPVKLEKCIIMQSEPTLLEPLPLIISALFSCLKKAQHANRTGYNEDDVVDEGLVSRIEDIFQSMITRMIKSEMEDFELDKLADFSNNTSVGKKNYILANLVMGCYETLIEYIFLQDDITEENGNNILQLYLCSKKIRDALHNGRKDTAKSSAGASLCGFSSPMFVKCLLDDLFWNESLNREAGMEVLRKDEDFLKYAAEVSMHAMSYAKDHGFMKGIGGRNKNLVQDACMQVGRACLHKFAKEMNEPTSCAIVHACIDTFHTALQYFCLRKRKRLEEFLSFTLRAVEGDNFPSSGLSVQLRHIRKFQRIVVSYLSEDISLSSTHRKLLPILLSILDTLSSVSCTESMEEGSLGGKPMHSSTPLPSAITQMNDWVAKLCSEQVIDDAPSTKSLINLHVRLSATCGPPIGTHKTSQGSEGAICDIAKDIHHIAGDAQTVEEEESRVDRKRGEIYSIIDECNVIQLVPLIVSNIDAAVDETDWLLQRVKGQVAALLADNKFQETMENLEAEADSAFHNTRRKIESAMCVRLGILLIAYRELIQAALPLGAPEETTLKGLAKLFTFLTNFTKYYAWLVSQDVATSPSPRFEKLAKLCGSEVTRYIYPFINYVESAQSSRITSTAQKRKRKESDKGAASTVSEKSRVLRETRAIPPLIYAVENFERFLMSLGRKCKIDLMSGHKLPTSRDFRIKSDIIKEALAQNDEAGSSNEDNEESTDDGDTEDEDSDEDVENASKRAKSD